MLRQMLVLIGCLMVSLSCGSGHEAQQKQEQEPAPESLVVQGDYTQNAYVQLPGSWQLAEWAVVPIRPADTLLSPSAVLVLTHGSVFSTNASSIMPRCDVHRQEALDVDVVPKTGTNVEITVPGTVTLLGNPATSVVPWLPPGGAPGKCMVSDAEGKAYWGPCL